MEEKHKEKCEKCDFYAIPMYMKKHVKIHDKDYNEQVYISCGECEAKFTLQKDLSNHVLTIHKGFKCDICNIRSTKKSSLAVHMITKHSSNELFYKCDGCDKAFRIPSQLKKHRENQKH